MNKTNSQKFLNFTFLALILLINYSSAITPSTKGHSTNFLATESNSEKQITSLAQLFAEPEPETAPAPAIDESLNAKTMENNGYLFYGYNAVYGNPHTNSGSLDPGFTNPIFESNYSQKITTGDLRFKVPNGSLFEKNVGCDVSMSSSEITGTSSYKKSLEAEVSVGGGFGPVAFSASASFKAVEEGSKNTKNIFIESKADCRVFKGHLQYYNPPKFHVTFLKALKFLEPKDYEANKKEYYIFIDYYGTHFIDQLVMGARYGSLEKTTIEEYTSQSSAAASVKIAGSYGAFNASGGVAGSTANSSTSSNQNKDRKIFSIGAAPPADGNTLTWAASAINEPMPIAYRLREINEIFFNPLFNLSQLTEGAYKIDIAKFKGNLEKAYKGYCPDYLKPNGVVKYCTAEEMPKDNQTVIDLTPKVIDVEKGVPVLFKNVSTGTCLININNKIFASGCNNGNGNQRFSFYFNSGSSSYMPRLSGTDGRMGWNRWVAGNELLFYPFTNAPNEQFQLIKKDANLYNILNGGLCLEVKSGNKGDNAIVNFQQCGNSDTNQLWRAMSP